MFVYSFTGFTTHSKSLFLENATLSLDETEVQVTCVFSDEYPLASCVLVYREYDNPVLTVIEYLQNTLFPASVKVNRSTEITLSIFGKNGDEEIDLQPIATKLVMASPVITSTTVPGRGRLLSIVSLTE